MSEYSSKCIICNTETSRAGRRHHLFSKIHQQDIWNAILKKKTAFASWIQSIESGNKTIIPSIHFFNTSSRAYKVCFACKNIDNATDMFHTCSCGDVLGNVAAIKDILENKTFVENPSYQHSVATETASVGIQTEGGGGGGDTERLQKTISQLKSQIQSERKTVEEAEDTAEALHGVLKMLQEYNLDVMLKAMKLLKKYNPLAFETQKNNFGDEWDDSLMTQDA
jgi:hypothetical protein